MEVAHTLEQDPRTAGFHIHQTSAGDQDIQPVRWSSGALPKGWVGARGSPTVVHPGRVAVAMGVGNEVEVQGTGQGAADNTEVPREVAGAS